MTPAKALPILMYHHVSPSPGLVTVSPAIFRQHMAALVAAGWRSAGLDEVAAFYRGEPVPAKTCVITFDDGYLDNYVYAHPVLREFGLKAVLFLVTDWVGEGPCRTGPQVTPDHNACKRSIAAGQADAVIVRWSEVADMVASGSFEFHSHTHSHRRWDREVADPVARRAALRADLLASRQCLAERLGQPSEHLCWPQGYFDADYVDTAVDAGFTHLYTTQKTVNRPVDSPLQIGRIVTKERDGDWLTSRTALYARPLLGRLYSLIRK